jgi:hypothetical protein
MKSRFFALRAATAKMCGGRPRRNFFAMRLSLAFHQQPFLLAKARQSTSFVMTASELVIKPMKQHVRYYDFGVFGFSGSPVTLRAVNNNAYGLSVPPHRRKRTGRKRFFSNSPFIVQIQHKDIRLN